ncbi:gamma subclass chorismate mutase AroQ [Streptomyces piniterrae]|uniref:chorismate mutase n=1 Tax=Streptomyces piniterrae TaxID=2571125 RepID=A0A4U0MU14_9ACTN|nr:gamma subclass chorismate mutase AroQ [Streptomyces piniterrae]TJZ44196.1 gamma subclass chorismate mutase AroQ [Streptomyces piniterrae]
MLRCRTWIAGAGVALLLAGGGSGAVAAPSGELVRGAAAITSVHSPYARLRPIAVLSAERLAISDLVAAAKWGTGSPIDDPVRERQVLDAVAEQARRLGADPVVTVRIFRDQIEASKVVQRGLHRVWDADPSQAPTERPDLGEVRKEINRISGELVRAIAGSADARSAPSCGPVLAAAAVRVRHERRLDGLHTGALARALPSVCVDGDGGEG